MLLIPENTKWMSHLKIILTALFSTEQVGGFMHTLYELSWWWTELPIVCFKFLNQHHKNVGIPETHETGYFKSENQQVITANLMIWWYIT